MERERGGAPSWQAGTGRARGARQVARLLQRRALLCDAAGGGGPRRGDRLPRLRGACGLEPHGRAPARVRAARGHVLQARPLPCHPPGLVSAG
jgi:hypothetical protein